MGKVVISVRQNRNSIYIKSKESLMSSKKYKAIPDRWLDYRSVGNRIPGTRFISFKVPLKQSLNRQLPCSDVFGPWELLDAMKKQNEELGLIIDLTFTKRYYTAEDIPNSLLCVKIYTAGHEIPCDKTILSFKRAVCRFLRHNTDNDKLIGVHCTHGLNRTGYLVCRYLIDVEGMDPKKAVDLFNSSRGHSIERENYIQDLQFGPKRSNEGMEELEQEPVRGQACYNPFGADHKEEGQHIYDYHSGPPLHTRRSQPSNHWLSPGGPPKSLLQNPYYPPPMGHSHPPQRWNQPKTRLVPSSSADPHQRRPLHLDTRLTYTHKEPGWGSSFQPEERPRGHYPPRQPAPPNFTLPLYSWGSGPNGSTPSKKWDGPKMNSYPRSQRR